MFSRLLASRKRPYIKNLDNLETVEMDLSGTKLCMQLPPQDFEFEEKPWQQRVNIHQMDAYDRLETDPALGPSGIQTSRLLHRSWNIYGSVMHSQPLGRIELVVCIADISMGQPAVIPNDFDCLNPASFETLILRHLYFDFGPGAGTSQYTAPLDWKLLNLNIEKLAVSLVAQSTEEHIKKFKLNPSSYTRTIFLPIEKDKYLLFYFPVSGFTPKEVSIETTEEFIGLLLAKTQVLAPNSDRVTDNNSTTYSKNRSPEEWKYHTFRRGDTFEGEPSEVLIAKGSNPPELTVL